MSQARRGVAGAALAALAAAAFVTATPSAARLGAAPAQTVPAPTDVTAAIDRLLDGPPLTSALVAARVVSLADGRTIYARNAGTLVMPASNMKLVTIAAAAARLGWDYRFRTTLDAAGTVRDGTLHGDLVVTGTGDPSITSPDRTGAALFDEWADALRRAGISRVDGRLIGDDTAFEDEPLGAGWSWDYLSAGYAAPSGALNYNENVVVLRIVPAAAAGLPAVVQIGPPGHGLDLDAAVTTAPAGSPAAITIARIPGDARLVVRGAIAAGSTPAIRTAAVDRPTRYFLNAMRLALASRGIGVTGGIATMRELTRPAATGPRSTVATRISAPFSSLAGYAMKVSQNFYGETFLKAIGATTGTGSAARGRELVAATLGDWGLPAGALVMADGSGLSRYDYVSADLLTGLLAHVWHDEALRGPFVAALPVGGRDGTLENRMRTPLLDRRVQAKTGTISNVRALSGYLTTAGGEKLAFSIIVNNATAPGARIDAVVEAVLAVLVR